MTTRSSYVYAILVLLFTTHIYGEEFVAIDGGAITYTMNTRGEEIVHDVYVDDFQMATTEATVAQWRLYMDDIDYDFPWTGHYWGDIAVISPGDNCPIQLIQINEAAAYCNWRSVREGLDVVYIVKGRRIIRNPDANGYRLPSVAEWDYAARGGRLSRGYIFAGSNNPTEVAWFARPYDEGTHPVGIKKPNELGLYDMSGNMREWCWPDIGIPLETSGSEEKLRLRGGAWTSNLEHTRLDFDRIVQVYLWSCAGFRLARNAE